MANGLLSISSYPNEGIGMRGSVVSAALGSKILLYLWDLATVCPGLAVSWRRLHDIGKSGKYWLVNFIPGIGGIIFTVWTLQMGEVGPNQYGPDPINESFNK